MNDELRNEIENNLDTIRNLVEHEAHKGAYAYSDRAKDEAMNRINTVILISILEELKGIKTAIREIPDVILTIENL